MKSSASFVPDSSFHPYPGALPGLCAFLGLSPTPVSPPRGRPLGACLRHAEKNDTTIGIFRLLLRGNSRFRRAGNKRFGKHVQSLAGVSIATTSEYFAL